MALHKHPPQQRVKIRAAIKAKKVAVKRKK